MTMRKKLYSAVIFSLFTIASMAQSTSNSAAANEGVMASNGKIYVVMTIVITILAGLIFYVARLDKKISKLEKEN